MRHNSKTSVVRRSVSASVLALPRLSVLRLGRHLGSGFTTSVRPSCRKVDSTLKLLMKEYQGRVRLAYRDFPLTQIHPQAERAAEAARCASEQGQFWPFHDLLFASPGLKDADLNQHARTLGLDMTRFESCLRDGKFRPGIDLDLKEGTQAGVDGTPGFFINGSFLSGAQPIAAFEQIIDAELTSAKKHGN